jgi:hypothetical protein
MLPSTQQEFFKDYSFNLFPQFPTEIRNYIWKISVEDYPARIVDLREYRRSISRASSPETQLTSKSDDIREVAGFKSRVPAPTVLYICRDSRYIAQESYTKAFGTKDMPAETWIDFEKDMLYLSLDFCYVALEGLPEIQLFSRFHTGRKEPHGYFLKELSQDIQKVKDLAISGLWSLGSELWDTTVLDDIFTITKLFVDLERFTLVDAQHAPDLTADLVFADESPYIFTQVQDPNYQGLMEYREGLFDCGYAFDDRVWAGLEPYPWFEFGTLVERQQGCVTSGTRRRKTGSRLATEEDRQRAIPDPELRAWRGGL